MTLTIELPPDTESLLLERARRHGKPLKEYVTMLIQRELNSTISLSEILAPIHATSPLANASEEELTRFSNEVIDEVRRERRAAGEVR